MSPRERQEQELRRVVDRVVERVGTLVAEPERALVEAFARRYFATAILDDLRDLAQEDLAGSVVALWRLARKRKPGQTLIRIYNPRFEEHGWQSGHTVVEVVADDAPFLVDSLTMLFVREHLRSHLVMHPVLCVDRDGEGVIRQIHCDSGREEDSSGRLTEAVLHFEIDHQGEAAALEALRDKVASVLADVRAVVEDWQPMRERIEEIVPLIESAPVAEEERREAAAFLRWLEQHHFTFIGFRACDLVTDDQEESRLRVVAGSGLGILRGDDGEGPASRAFANIPAPLRGREAELLVITKSTALSTVHRPVHLDYIGVKRFDGQGEAVGEWRFLGLYGSAAYSAHPRDIPILRRKFEYVMERSGFPPAGHDYKALQHILETFPRDEMFQFSREELFDVAMGILQVRERQRLGLFLRRDTFGRFITALVFVPRDRYDTQLRRRIQEILMEALEGQSCEFNIQLSESPLARVHFIIRTRPDAPVEYDEAQLQARMSEALLSWQDGLLSALYAEVGEGRAPLLYDRYADAFPHAYRDDYSPRTAVQDILRLERLDDDQGIVTHLHQPPEAEDALLRFKVLSRKRTMPLSDVMPMLERMGLRVLSARPYQLRPAEGGPALLTEFDMVPALGVGEIDLLAVKELFQEAFARVCRGEMENDGFNRLVLAAGTPWREVVLLRAMCKYLLQTRMPFSQSYMEDTLARHPAIVRLLIRLFHQRFEPGASDAGAAAETAQEIVEALEQVANLDEDRILRNFLQLIQAMLRTNFFQRTGAGGHKPYLSFKLDPRELPALPEPRPMFEIFVYSPRVEGVHLRGGPVARGGIRWSDRREDFRTEILGLMKAQMVKNAVIVPVGAKGGFVAKQLPAGDDRDAVMAEVVTCYRTYIRGLLDLTDNLREGEVVPPAEVVRHDGDDPYLVVAADKGTATFSDIANALAAEYGFWLGDAFASGGSVGYDHKKMGITARGAWESVKRHFRELGKDIQNEPFTVAGIGDMSGDVFGNGMLLSPHIKLVAAFNHMHIFIDPDPDPATSYEERKRLFQLPRSAWSDYDEKLISRGGGVYSRRAKSIRLSPEARRALGTEAERVTPNELIQIILRAPVELLWNGGIGTYVKAGSERHADVGDRANDAVRVDATELRCKVVGEGGNLGFTQLGRIEYALAGGKINTDAIDNSGGVDCSDHEVNIKILLDHVVADGDLTVKQRNALLLEMTDEVARHVLEHNYLQSQAISIAAHQAPFLLSDHARFIRRLEKEGRLQRRLEFLPDDETIAEREARQQGLTRPEIAVMIAYSKVRLFEELMASDVARDPYLSRELVDYFPHPMRERFADRMERHPLRHEIIATQITNSLVNRMGGTFWTRTQETTGDHAADIARAYTVAREVFRIAPLWRQIEALDNRVDAAIQLQMQIETRRLLDHASLWFLRNRRPPLDISATIGQFEPAAATLRHHLTRLMKGDNRIALARAMKPYTEAGVNRPLALHVAMLESWYAALDITEVAQQGGHELLEVARMYFGLYDRLDLHWMVEQIKQLPRLDPWQRKARTALMGELNSELRALTTRVLESTEGEQCAEGRINAWLTRHRIGIEHYQGVLEEIRAAGATAELPMLMVAMRELRALNHATGQAVAQE